MTRFRILAMVAAALFCWMVWNWISGWGLVTVDVEDERVAKIVRSIERQAGVTILGDFDPEQKLSMFVYRVPVAEAVEVLAARLDANWSLLHAVGQDTAESKRLVAALSNDTAREEGLRVIRSGGGFFDGFGEVVPDPRKVEVTVEEMESGDLHGYLDQIAQKTGASFVVAEEWNPMVSRLPKRGRASATVGNLISSVGGKSTEVFYIRGARPDEIYAASDDVSAATRAGGAMPGRGDRSRRPDGERLERPEARPEWIAERVEAQIAQLPAGEREQARKDFQEMRAFWEEIRSLPEDQRRARFQELMEDPRVQARMEERRALREDRAGPERRADRYRRYIDRREDARNSL